MKALKHAMIDLETMGITPDSAIVSVGVVIFDPRYGKVSDKTFYRELDWVNQDRSVCKDTRAWWDKQAEEAQIALYGIDELEDVLFELSDFLPTDCKVWGNGATFDISILEDAYRQQKIEIPWKYWNVRDVRTIKDMYESKRGGFNKKSGGTLHNALDDAYFQSRYVTMMWNKLLGE